MAGEDHGWPEGGVRRCVLYDSRQIQIERLADVRWSSKQPWKRAPGLSGPSFGLPSVWGGVQPQWVMVTDQPQKFEEVQLVD